MTDKVSLTIGVWRKMEKKGERKERRSDSVKGQLVFEYRSSLVRRYIYYRLTIIAIASIVRGVGMMKERQVDMRRSGYDKPKYINKYAIKPSSRHRA